MALLTLQAARTSVSPRPAAAILCRAAGWEALWQIVTFPRADLPRAAVAGSCCIVVWFTVFKNVETIALGVIRHWIIYKWNSAAAGHLGFPSWRRFSSSSDDFSDMRKTLNLHSRLSWVRKTVHRIDPFLVLYTAEDWTQYSWRRFFLYIFSSKSTVSAGGGGWRGGR
jgi:hypothetical protein